MAVLKYEEIADALRQRITDEEFGPDDLLPSQRELMALWNVSRATVIKAYDTLERDGLVDARQGQGYRVSTTPLARPAGGRKSGSSRASGRAFRIVGSPTREVPPARIAACLGLGEGQEALRRERLVQLTDGSACSSVVAWFPPDIADVCPKLASAKPIIEGTTRYIQRMTGRVSVRGVDVKRVRLGTESEAAWLECDLPFPVVELLHTAVDQEGKAIVVEYGVTPGDVWEETETYPMGDGH
ncbi:GntR family transcriptional regulator [Streptomyces apocyni]|uniref:GntR family transcriptional regulator n=1 Tax=Streptomyces apocyni TaxID=2654677 RepID=UPI0012EA6010|nr:GntR family transcriptional regulator [Streptomyces apocyni]